MVRYVWDHRRDQIAAAARNAKRQITQIDAQIEVLLTRILNTSNTSIIQTYETKLADLEHNKALFIKQATQKTRAPNDTFQETLEPVPWAPPVQG